MPLVFGLGSGRCGTTTLASLLDSQADAICFHEVNPAAMAWEGTEHAVHSIVRDFEAIRAGAPASLAVDLTWRHGYAAADALRVAHRPRVVGDVALYYLPYAELLLNDNNADIRMPCMRRDKAATIDSFIRKLKLTDATEKRPRKLRKRIAQAWRAVPTMRNHWVHDKTRWITDNQWDKVFPTLAEDGELDDVLGQYWDLYYARAEQLASSYPDRFRVFDVDTLNTSEGRRDVLAFCGIAAPEVTEQMHENHAVAR